MLPEPIARPIPTKTPDSPQSKPPPLSRSPESHMAPARSRPSYLSLLVREQAKIIVEPVLAATAAYMATLPPDSDSESDTNGKGATGRRGSKKNSHGRKPRRYGRSSTTGATVVDPSSNPLLRPRGPGGLFQSASAREKDSAITIGAADANAISPASGSVTMPPPPPTLRKRRHPSISAPPMELSTSGEQESASSGKAKRTRRPLTQTRTASSSSTRTKTAATSASAAKNGRRASSSRSVSASTAASAMNAPDQEPRPKIILKIRRPTLIPSGHINGNHERAMQHTTSKGQENEDLSHSSSRASSVLHPVVSTIADQNTQDAQAVKPEHEGGIASDADLESVSMSQRTETEPPSLPVSDNEDGGAQIRNGDDGFDGGESEQDMDDQEVVAVGGRSKSLRKRPETYKIPWSDAEHKLLDKLMNDIPKGTKNRCVSVVQDDLSACVRALTILA